MRPAIALGLMHLAGLGPRTIRGFMPLWFAGKSWPEVQCIVDEHAPTDSLYTVDPYGTGRRVVCGQPSTWALLGAHNVAQAYRPAGVP